ncbi:glucosamine inositolphosphorylceramide transferase family protein [Paenibacillus gansuensis]|uniref:Family 43 glycosylhydrolase n=1 Tax=Paenibacillus gansuensis TaxID=306542 RepID=A0ABW5PIT2_9BACL
MMNVLRKEMLHPVWSIKVFPSQDVIREHPGAAKLAAPTLQAKDVTDIPAAFVADPFLVRHGTGYYLFFEVLNKATGKGDIAAASSHDGVTWKYEQVVLTEPYHLSYPQVFLHEGDYYMIPETVGAGKVLLYRAVEFPYRWEVAESLLDGRYTDPSIFQYNGKWWMLGGARGRQLHLFVSDRLEGPWTEHPQSPVIRENPNVSRPGGRIIQEGNRLYRYMQDGEPYYGSSTRMAEITVLTECEYAETELGIVLEGSRKEQDWSKDGMHHIDQLKLEEDMWMVAVDGHYFEREPYVRWKLRRVGAKLARYIKR